MLYVRAVLCSLTLLAGVAQAEEPSRPAAAPISAHADEVPDAPPPVRHRGLRIALGIVGGALLIGAIVAVGVTNASNNQTGYNDWGTLVVMRR